MHSNVKQVCFNNNNIYTIKKKYYGSPARDFFLGDLPSRVMANKTCVNMGYPISDVSINCRTPSENRILKFIGSVTRESPQMIPLNLKKLLILVLYRIQLGMTMCQN